ncbi:MAG: phosphonate C-P lyase system protein PhnG [Hyphomicrobiaceae bacterium]|nr:phosphonate C-P lyase system protein PhnG [Hyphomicrobiaceae bacterium]
MTKSQDDTHKRGEAMALLARAESSLLAAVIERFGPLGVGDDLKQPECGLVMIRGRIGGDGAAFNVGETTVVRAVVRLKSGATGYGLRLGRDVTAARHAAILDALWQAPETRSEVEATVLVPTRCRLEHSNKAAAAAAASSRVEFFTMAREAS